MALNAILSVLEGDTERPHTQERRGGQKLEGMGPGRPQARSGSPVPRAPWRGVVLPTPDSGILASRTCSKPVCGHLLKQLAAGNNTGLTLAIIILTPAKARHPCTTHRPSEWARERHRDICFLERLAAADGRFPRSADLTASCQGGTAHSPGSAEAEGFRRLVGDPGNSTWNLLLLESSKRFLY